MGLDVKVTCDNCNRNLTDTINSADYRILVSMERLPTKGSKLTSLYKLPPLTRSYYFCNKDCLKLLINNGGLE